MFLIAKKGEGGGGIYFFGSKLGHGRRRNRAFVHGKNYAPGDGINLQRGCGNFHPSPTAASGLWANVRWALRVSRSRAPSEELELRIMRRFRLALRDGFGLLFFIPRVTSSPSTTLRARVHPGLLPVRPSGTIDCRPTQVAEKLIVLGEISEKLPSGVKTPKSLMALSARVNSCPFKTVARIEFFRNLHISSQGSLLFRQGDFGCLCLLEQQAILSQLLLSSFNDVRGCLAGESGIVQRSLIVRN